MGNQATTWSRANCPPEAKLIYVFTDAQVATENPAFTRVTGQFTAATSKRMKARD